MTILGQEKIIYLFKKIYSK